MRQQNASPTPFLRHYATRLKTYKPEYRKSLNTSRASNRLQAGGMTSLYILIEAGPRIEAGP